MLRLNLLGAVDLVDATGRSKNTGGTKNLALLSFLAVEGANRPVRRDTVAALLWPEAEQKNARQSLSQSLHVLRNSIGEVVLSRGQEELILDHQLLQVDCAELVDHANAGRLEQAVDLYKGDFATGLHVKESPEFDDWLSRQRTFWRDQLAAVIKGLYRSAIDKDDLLQSAAWAERLLAVAPEQDAPVKELLPLLIERGHSAAAIRLFDRYEHTLRELFELSPSPELAALVDKLRTNTTATSTRLKSIHVADPLRGVAKPKPKTVAVALIVVAVLLVGLRLIVFLPSNARGAIASASSAAPKVAVMRFAYGNSSQRAANVLNDALQWRLHDVGFDVVNAGNQDTAAIRRIANGQQGMTFMVGGDVETRADASLVAHLWLKDAVSGKRLWDSEFTQDTANAHLIATQLSEVITTQIRKAAGQAVDFTPDARKVSIESWRAVYRARERMEAAVDMRREGSVAGSQTELTDADATLIDLTKRESEWVLPWLLRARIAEARGMTALVSGDLRRGGEELERGVRLLDSVPNDVRSADVHEMRGRLLYQHWVLGIDDVTVANRVLNSAEADLRTALRLGHERSDSYVALSGVMFAQGKYVESFVYARRAYDSNVFLRSNEEIVNRLFNSAFHAADDAAADQWCKELGKLQPGRWPGVMCRVHLAGFAPKLVSIRTLQSEIDDLADAPPIRSAMQPRLKAAYAISLAQLGMRDSAQATLAGLTGNAEPGVVLLSAFALATLKDAPQAHAMLRKYLSEFRGTRSTALHMRWLHQGSQIQTPLTQ